MPVLASFKTRYGGGSVCSVCLRAGEHVFKQLYSPVLPSSISHQFRQHLLTVVQAGEEEKKERETETDRQTQTETDRQREKDRD